jgi:hypothetical protein
MKNVFKFSCAVLLALALSLPAALAESGQKLSLTTGLPTDKEYKPVQITLDNEPGARPQVGMSHADVVYEFECYTNGYTRYLAIFNDDVPKIAEGCRSTRVPALEMYANFGGSLAHYGGWNKGDADVNSYIDKLNVDAEFDGIKGDSHYYRDKKRKMPHNAVAELQSMQEDTPEVEERQMLHFSADAPTVKGEDAKELSITYRTGYVSSFKYDAKKNAYNYYFNGKQFKDGGNGSTLPFANVIIIKFDYSFADGRSNTPMIDSTGTHTVEYYIGGKHFTGTCERESVSTTTKFLDDEGNEVQFQPGKTYIALPDTSREVKNVA